MSGDPYEGLTRTELKALVLRMVKDAKRKQDVHDDRIRVLEAELATMRAAFSGVAGYTEADIAALVRENAALKADYKCPKCGYLIEPVWDGVHGEYAASPAAPPPAPETPRCAQNPEHSGPFYWTSYKNGEEGVLCEKCFDECLPLGRIDTGVEIEPPAPETRCAICGGEVEVSRTGERHHEFETGDHRRHRIVIEPPAKPEE